MVKASSDISVELLKLLKKIQLLFKSVNLLPETVVFLYNLLKCFQLMHSFNSIPLQSHTETRDDVSIARTKIWSRQAKSH